ncbi:MFS transporter [Actinorhabdospora filicis]|uniref:MFS transporter n=1 Tax=Actinorhabdospora filicis TaxID=1785913 RepID=A0A9W6SRW2_9ACTN|nr:MFS transporter [Actinorhabdospora filicis]GLZ79616.1 MFS transporter [Actinorhabdospora filicis]
MLLEAPARAAHRDGNVLRWLGAYTTSVTGDVVYFLTLSWAASRAGGPAQVGLVLAAGAVPRAVLMLAGGVVADRFGPRRVVIAADLVRCVVMGAAAVSALFGPSLWTLVGVALVFGAADAMFMPAVGALPPRLTGPDQLTRVQAMRSLAVRASNACGPLIAAAALGLGSPAGFGTAAALFAVSLVLLAATRLRPVPDSPRAGGPWRDLREGLRHLRGDRVLSRLVVVIGLGEMCFSGPVAAGLVLLTGERGWAAGVLGGLLSGFSVGGAVSGLGLLAVGRFRRPGAVMALSLAASGILVAATGVLASPVAAIVCSGALGLSGGVAMVVGAAELQARTEPRYLGRITAVSTLATLGLSPLLLPLAGLVSQRWGAAWFFGGCAAVCLTAAALAPRIGRAPAKLTR